MADSPRILVVEDEEVVRNVVVRWLSSWGFDVSTACTGDDAVARLAAEPADVIISDLIMPVRDGVWLLEQVRDRWPHIVIIVASGAQEERTIAKTRELGAVAFLPKPYGREMMRAALERAFLRREQLLGD